MWRAPKLHLAAGAFIASETPLQTILMCMLLEQYKMIRQLKGSRDVSLLPDHRSQEEA
jgi:hypothetical protein